MTDTTIREVIEKRHKLNQAILTLVQRFELDTHTRIDWIELDIEERPTQPGTFIQSVHTRVSIPELEEDTL